MSEDNAEIGRECSMWIACTYLGIGSCNRLLLTKKRLPYEFSAFIKVVELFD